MMGIYGRSGGQAQSGFFGMIQNYQLELHFPGINLVLHL
jgi:hypothetical protein